MTENKVKDNRFRNSDRQVFLRHIQRINCNFQLLSVNYFLLISDYGCYLPWVYVKKMLT